MKMIKKGTTRIVYGIGSNVIKLPRIHRWKCFLRGILANLDETLWYRSSPNEWKEKMCPVVHCFMGGLILIAKKAEPIDIDTFKKINKADYYPIPTDMKSTNFGLYKNNVVLVDYADSRYFCSDCENIIKGK